MNNKNFFLFIPVFILFQAFFASQDLSVLENSDGLVEHSRDGVIPATLNPGAPGASPKLFKKSSFKTHFLQSFALVNVHREKPQSVPVFFFELNSLICNQSLCARAPPAA